MSILGAMLILWIYRMIKRRTCNSVSGGRGQRQRLLT